MKRTVASLALAAACALAAPFLAARPAEAAALDPNVKMFTLETPHFRVNYPAGYDAIAQKGAAFAEEAYDEVTAYFKTVPRDKVEFTIFDHEDTVNGLALPYVSSAMYIYLTNPDSDLLWGRYDDWFKLVITHEFTHIMHFETVEGAPKHLNDLFGRILFPNLFQPTFLIEGLAVTTESMFTAGGKGGRLHDGNYDMLLRGDVINHRQLTLDQAGGYYLTDFPGGDTPYVYGTFFYEYMAETYGADKPPKIAHAYAAAPWLGIDHAVAEVIPGRDAQQIWDELLHWLRRRAQTQIAEIQKWPVTVTTPLTHTSYHHHHPTYMPDGRLTYIEGLRHSPTGIKLVLERPAKGEPVVKHLLAKSQYGDYDISRDGKSIYYANSRGPNNYSSYDDIYRFDVATGETQPLTTFARMNNPGISPDGQHLLAVRNGKGLNDLFLLDKAGKVLKQLTAFKEAVQFTAPRWSPDGKHIIISTWRQASRDLYMVDTEKWTLTPMWKDDAVDVGAVWSPDGKYVIFSSDRGNRVFNLFAFDWQARDLYQVTNVLTGVIEPDVRPDGKEIAMTYCNGTGFDIHTMPYDPASWRKLDKPVFDTTIKPLVFQPKTTYPHHDYSPLPSLMPKFWSPIYLSNPPTLGVFTIGYDVLLTNTVFGLAGYGTAGLTANLPTDPSTNAVATLNPLDLSSFTLLYANSQFDTNLSAFANAYPNKYSIPLASGATTDLFQRFQNYSLSVAWNNLPSPLTNASYQTGDTWTLGANLRLVSDMTPAALNADAQKAKLMPEAKRSHSISLQYKYNDNGKYGYSPAPEYGTLYSWGAEVAHPAMLSETEYYRVAIDWRHYFPTWWTHHTIGLRLLSGVNLGKPQGDFYLGGSRSVNQAGTPDVRVAWDPDDVLIPLRGYPFASAAGNTIGLMEGEYRFPIMELQHGPASVPLFAERLAGSFFFDTGTTYTNNWLSFVGRTAEQGAKAAPDLTDLRAGVGAELRLNFKIANNPLNTTPLAQIARSAVPALNAFNDSAGMFRLGIGQSVLPLTNAKGEQFWLGPQVYTEFGTMF